MVTLSTDRSLEQLLCEELKVIGSVVAIGRPNDVLVRNGATRVYVGEGGDWQTCVKELTATARATVLVAGKSPGLLWEQEHARRKVDPTRLLLVFPAVSRGERKKMARNVERVFGVTLPAMEEWIRAPRLMVFDEGWQAKLLPNVYSGRALHLFGLPFSSLNDYWKCKESVAPFVARFQVQTEKKDQVQSGT